MMHKPRQVPSRAHIQYSPARNKKQQTRRNAGIKTRTITVQHSMWLPMRVAFTLGNFSMASAEQTAVYHISVPVTKHGKKTQHCDRCMPNLLLLTLQLHTPWALHGQGTRKPAQTDPRGLTSIMTKEQLKPNKQTRLHKEADTHYLPVVL